MGGRVEVQRTLMALEDAYRAGVENTKLPPSRRRPGLLQDGDLGRTFSDAYRAWMQARADMGDRWVLSLGYEPHQNTLQASR